METQLVLLEGESRPVPIIPAGFYIGKPRPSHTAKEILIAVASKLLSEVMEWGSFGEKEESQVGEQILMALEYGDRDGYEIAKYLEKTFYWDPDAELVQILDNADFHGCHREALKSWIRDNNIKPTLEVGRQVKVKLRREPEYTGTIRSISDDGMYCVMIPAKGHVEDGSGTHGILLPWEDVEAWQTADTN